MPPAKIENLFASSIFVPSVAYIFSFPMMCMDEVDLPSRGVGLCMYRDPLVNVERGRSTKVTKGHEETLGEDSPEQSQGQHSSLQKQGYLWMPLARILWRTDESL